ncbi:MAG: DUF3443 family protein [Rhodoferax sp.]|nr:DUF3443 family protein [Rhodoferax sp.]
MENWFFIRRIALCLCLSLWALSALTSCGGGTQSQLASIQADFPSSAASLADPNVVAVTVEAGQGRNVNMPYVSVTVCVPGTNTCKTIDHVLLDTGSAGLRLFASVLNAAEPLTLPPHQIGDSSSISECAQFIAALAWGQVHLADVRIGAEQAANVPIQLMDPDFPDSLSDSCGSNPVIALDAANSQQYRLSANGILGVGRFAHDGQNYFNCTTSSTCLIAPSPKQQVQNPVALFPVNNNGVALQLPGISDEGVTIAKGFLIFGIGTQTNNRLEAATVIPLNPRSGTFTTVYKGKSFANSFIDSGSNGYFFPDDSISTPACTENPDFFCPASTQSLTASIQLSGKTTIPVNFSIANADTLLSNARYAFNNLGGSMDSVGFVWGLPFFFGRKVFTVMEGGRVDGWIGPFYAFTDLPNTP